MHHKLIGLYSIRTQLKIKDPFFILILLEENVIVIDLCIIVPSHESTIKSTTFVSFQEELTVYNNNRQKVNKRRINMTINIILPILIDDNGLIEGSILFDETIV